MLRTGFAAIRAELGVEVDVEPAALDEAQVAAAAPGPARRDLRDLPFVTLDPPGSTDLDQAMHLRPAGDGFLVHYAIADTAQFIRPGGPLDRAAHRRVTTIYCPDTRVPLYPPLLSEDAASLRAGHDRPAVVWTLRLAADGTLVETAVERATVRSRAQLDYPSAQGRLDSGVPDDDPLALLAAIGTLRQAIERDRGGVSLGRPEQEVVDTPDGWALTFRAPLAIEEHNAQLSLLTGMAAARLMLDAGVGVLRTMPSAGPHDLARLRRQALALGVPWPTGAPYAEVLRAVDHTTANGAAFLAAATGLFRGAAWTPFDGDPPTEVRHGAVGAPYAHVTAPLRRLVDRYGLEVCLAVHAGRPVPDWVRHALPGLGTTMAGGARRAAAVDRACTDLVEAVLLEDRVGEGFTGIVLDDRTVQLDGPAVVARLEQDGLREGARVRVRLVEADPATRRVRFVPMVDPPRPDGGDVGRAT